MTKKPACEASSANIFPEDGNGYVDFTAVSASSEEEPNCPSQAKASSAVSAGNEYFEVSIFEERASIPEAMNEYEEPIVMGFDVDYDDKTSEYLDVSPSNGALIAGETLTSLAFFFSCMFVETSMSLPGCIEAPSSVSVPQ